MNNKTFKSGAAFIDGVFVPIASAKISVLDWGLLHSDATYDVVHVWDGAFFRLTDHIQRFESGMARLHMKIPHSATDIVDIVTQCVRLTGLKEAYVEIVCTRGVPPVGSRDPRDCVNRFFAFAIPFSWIANQQQREKGLRLHISQVQRIAPESVDPTIKNYHWLDLTRGLFDAYAHHQDTAVLVDGQGNVVEGPGFNLFALTDKGLVTPCAGVLEGITRQTAITLARQMDVEVLLRALSIEELRGAHEVFITSTAGGVMPVCWIDGVAVGDGRVGVVTQQMTQLYWDAHKDPRYSTLAY
ncbi:branched-chain amino acid transferase [Pseudomonas gingeri NCPPB 3146 = LMG 5327]|uniref:Aminodeoxychorismate lyase n=4 Tax=Pseudomonas gingeri TaxID=117681 RepID=A0A7Y7XVD5_9PSED|nr:aminotransferase class IV [Pseudomonas gingeri]NWC13008.1 aminotransferase class IV [Pseudomonas gingeri]PNQ88487.1 branched-chain amino acid transferase [Pseudomonas gingeri NCPPB 3146 = LMG 5327]